MVRMNTSWRPHTALVTSLHFSCRIALYGQNEHQLASPYRPRVVSPFLLQDIQHSLPTMSVQFSSRRYVCATNRLSENSPTLFLKQFQFLPDRDDGHFSPFQRRQSSSFSFYASLLQAIDGMLPTVTLKVTEEVGKIYSDSAADGFST